MANLPLYPLPTNYTAAEHAEAKRIVDNVVSRCPDARTLALVAYHLIYTSVLRKRFEQSRPVVLNGGAASALN